MGTKMVSKLFNAGHHFSMEYNHVPSGVDLHWHDCYELDIILSGTGTTVCNGQVFDARRGTVSLLSPADFHEYKDCVDLRTISVKFPETHIDDSLLRHFLNVKSYVIYADEATLSLMISLCRLLGQLESDKFNTDYDNRLIECLITAFLKCCAPETSRTIDSELIQKAVLYINGHYRDNPSTSEVAQMLHLCNSYFCRLFKKCVGISYKGYLKKLKLEYGYKLIVSTDLPITQVAFRCGYGNQSHFNREFKKYFLASPSSFRQKQTDLFALEGEPL